jgi:hypothetical protein
VLNRRELEKESSLPVTIRVTDALAALDYASRCLPEAVKTQQVLDTARYRQVGEETGELLPGVEVIPAYGNDSFNFQP